HTESWTMFFDRHRKEPTMRHRRTLALVVVALTFAIAVAYGTRSLTTVGAAENGLLPGMAAVSGTVEAAAPFKAAQVHLLNTDKNGLFLVHTAGRPYPARHLWPGRYQ